MRETTRAGRGQRRVFDEYHPHDSEFAFPNPCILSDPVESGNLSNNTEIALVKTKSRRVTRRHATRDMLEGGGDQLPTSLKAAKTGFSQFSKSVKCTG